MEIVTVLGAALDRRITPWHSANDKFVMATIMSGTEYSLSNIFIILCNIYHRHPYKTVKHDNRR